MVMARPQSHDLKYTFQIITCFKFKNKYFLSTHGLDLLIYNDLIFFYCPFNFYDIVHYLSMLINETMLSQLKSRV